MMIVSQWFRLRWWVATLAIVLRLSQSPWGGAYFPRPSPMLCWKFSAMQGPAQLTK